MSKIYTCRLYEGKRKQFSDLLDRDVGCICPDEQPDDESLVKFNEDCPVHQLEKVQLN